MPKSKQVSSEPISKGFEALAEVYDAMMRCVFWGNIERSQICFLEYLPKQATVLIIGGGTGWIVEAIWKIRPEAKIVYVELSPKMLSKTKQRIPKHKATQIQLLLGDENAIPDGVLFDAVCTFFFLDLFPEKKASPLVSLIDKSLKTNGLWLYADFEAQGSKCWFKKNFIHLMYLVCACFCKLENTTYWHYSSAIQHLQYKQMATKTFNGGLIRAYCFSKVRTKISSK